MKIILQLSCIVLVLILFQGNIPSSKVSKQPSILFIAVDDLRPELGCYGNEVIQSPNIDRLASQGTTFTNHFVVVPTCGASRQSLLTGLLPTTRQHISNRASVEFLTNQPETTVPETFVHHLKRNGYYTVGIGKISHSADGLVYGYQESPEGAPLELPHSWDEMLFDAGKWGTGWNAFFGYADGSNRNTLQKEVKPYEAADVDDNGYPDGLTANLAIEKLQALQSKGDPFFLGVGFFKPHLPFNAPKKYWDLYNREDIPLSPAPGLPEGINLASLHGSGEFNQYKLGEEKASLEASVSEAYAQKLRHAYYAAVSYVDAQVGKVLDELDNLGLAENTIVVLWGDHGWHLGDQRVWGKHTCFDWALRSALIIKNPKQKRAVQVDEVVSTLDIYPTLMDLTKVKMPYPADGTSMKKLLRNKGQKRWRNTAYSYYRNGISVRTPRYRLTKYFREKEPASELYDHEADPHELENSAAEMPGVIESLNPIWEKGNTGLYEN